MKRKRTLIAAIAVSIAAIAVAVTVVLPEPVPARTSKLSGAEYFEELMQCNSMNRFREIFRMDRRTFNGLRNLLVTEGNLKKGLRICEGEKLLIFIHILRGLTTRTVAERFQHSNSTISDIIREVILALYQVRHQLLVQAPPNHPDSAHIAQNPKFYPFLVVALVQSTELIFQQLYLIIWRKDFGVVKAASVKM
jgi:hypothetical protein